MLGTFDIDYETNIIDNHIRIKLFNNINKIIYRLKHELGLKLILIEKHLNRDLAIKSIN